MKKTLAGAAAAFLQWFQTSVSFAMFERASRFIHGRYAGGKVDRETGMRRERQSVVGDKAARSYRKRYTHILSGIVTARQLDAIQRRAAA